jgi:hypothetical protein
MWSDLSFSSGSFSPKSFGPSWGFIWEEVQDEILFIGGGGPEKSDSRRGNEPEYDVFDEPYKAFVKRINEQRAAEWQKFINPSVGEEKECIAKTLKQGYYSHVGQSAPENNETEAAEKAAFVIMDAKRGVESARETLGKLIKTSKQAIESRADEEAALLAFAMMMMLDED